MGDPAALQEAIQRARQLAAKISQSAPVKRTASEMDDHSSLGTVKVTLAYEKPANSDRDTKREERSSSSHREGGYGGRDREFQGYPRGRERDRSREDRDSAYSGSSGINNNNNNDNSNYNYPRNNNDDTNRSDNNPPTSGFSMLSGQSNYMGSSSSNEEKIEIIIPHSVIGLVIGKGGENIKRIQNETGATVRVDPSTVDEKGNKVCTITGTKQAVEDAHNQVANVIENAATNKRPRTQYEGGEQYRMIIPASRTGAIIGKGGETIKSIKQQSGCDIELDKNAKECGPEESVFVIRGTQDKIAKARALIEARLASRGRDGDNQHRMANHRDHSAPKGVATGANAAPVAQFTDLPASYPASGQQNSADMSAAWAAYFAQYSTLFNQAGVQPGATPGMPAYAGQNMVGAACAPQVPQPEQQVQPQQPPAQAASGGQQDYTDQWIQYYILNGRPDYAERIIEMKKQHQQQEQKQQAPQ